MRIGILPIGQIAQESLEDLAQGLSKLFPNTSCSIISEAMPIPKHAFDKKRKQHNSSIILSQVKVFASQNQKYDRVLGVIDTDIFVSGLNFVFGEAYTPGKAALISLWRLRPEFYLEKADKSIFSLRTLKEAIHELEHTLGLPHCPRTF